MIYLHAIYYFTSRFARYARFAASSCGRWACTRALRARKKTGLRPVSRYTGASRPKGNRPAAGGQVHGRFAPERKPACCPHWQMCGRTYWSHGFWGTIAYCFEEELNCPRLVTVRPWLSEGGLTPLLHCTFHKYGFCCSLTMFNAWMIFSLPLPPISAVINA